MNKTIVSLFISVPLIFIGCYEIENSDSSVVTSKSVSNDTSGYDAIISKLEGNADTTEEYMLLAAAYMSRSGLSLDEVIKTICDSAMSEEGNSFMTFVNSVEFATQGCETALLDVNKATDYHMLIIGDKCEQPSLLSDFEKDVCLYKGLTQTMEAANTVNYISGDEVLESDVVDNRLKASSCAMQFAFNGVVDDGCSITEVTSISFSQSSKEYDRIAVYTNGEEFEYLLTQSYPREVVVTDGFCTLNDFSSRDNIVDSGEKYYACPITTGVDDKEITTTNSLVDSLNEGTSTIIAVGDNHSELVSAINQFKEEIQDISKNSSTEDVIYIDDMVEYLDSQNR